MKKEIILEVGCTYEYFNREDPWIVTLPFTVVEKGPMGTLVAPELGSAYLINEEKFIKANKITRKMDMETLREVARSAGILPIIGESRVSFDNLIPKIKQWADDRDLVHIENTGKQFMKVNEELGELASALLKGNLEATKDGLGDTFVTLLLLAFQNDLDPAECLNIAYNEIANRKGVTVEGTFIKSE